MEPTNRIFGSKLRAGACLFCTRCEALLDNDEAYVCQGCQATYDRACLSVRRRCACGSQRFARHEPRQEAVGLFAAMASAVWSLLKLELPLRRAARPLPVGPRRKSP